MRRSSARAEPSVLPDQSVPLSGIRPRPTLPTELVDAIATALACEARETDVHLRAELLARIRDVTEAWLAGALTIVEALEALAAPAEAQTGIGLRRLR